jgi:hypothetical protein
MTYQKTEPACNREDCFACVDGKCVLLNNNDFGKRECPFYKTNDKINNTEED